MNKFYNLKRKFFLFFFLKLYERAFEVPFLQATGKYYREEGNRCLGKYNRIQYMKKVIERKERILTIYFYFKDFIIN